MPSWDKFQPMFHKHKRVLTILLVIILVILAFGAGKLDFSMVNSQKASPPENRPFDPKRSESEINKIKTTFVLDEQVKIYKELIEKVGPIEAQEALYRSGLPFDGQTHLLNHTVGDYLFNKYGDEGLIYCKDYFLSSCYHGFVLRVVAAKGFDGLNTVMDMCERQGPAVGVQCSHAIGHGLLTYHGYANLTKALEGCDQMAEKRPTFPIFNCHDGVFMENIWGIHDGKPSPDRWVKEDDHLYPCNDPRIDEKYIQACWAEQPTIMYMQFKGDLRKIGDECLKVINPAYQATCFDALARQIHPLVRGSVDETFKMCGLMPEGWINPCIVSIARAFISVGDVDAPFKICGRIEEAGKESCYQNLIFSLNYAAKNPTEKNNLCQKIEDANWKASCLR